MSLLTIKNNILNFFTKPVVQIFSITLIIHCCAVIIFHFAPIPFLSKTGDDALYLDLSSQISHLLHLGSYHWGDIYHYHWYPLFLGILFYFFGTSAILGSMVNAILAAGSAVIIYCLFQEYRVSKSFSYWGALAITNLYASYVYHSSILLKESWIVFLLLVIVFSARKMSQGKWNRIVMFGVALVSWILLRNLRFFIGLAAIVGFFIEWFLNAQLILKKKIIYGFCMIVIISACAIVLSGNGLFRAQSIASVFNLHYIHQIRTYSERAATANHIDIIETDSAGSAKSISVLHFTQAFMNVFIGPFPWQISVAKYIMILADTLFIYITLIVLIFSTIKVRLRGWKSYIPMIIVAGILAVAVTLGSDNIGANIRQRMTPTIMLAIAACIAYDRFKHHHEQV